MEKKTATIEQVNAMPAATWHFLSANHTQLETPDSAGQTPNVQADIPADARGAGDEFERALAEAQVAWEAAHPAPTDAELAERAAFLAAEADATYGGTAQSAYQADADSLEEARSLARAFAHGTGADLAGFLRSAAGERLVIAAPNGKTVDSSVTVTSVAGATNVAAIDVVAKPGSTVNLSLLADADASREEAAQPTDAGTVGTTVRVFADRDARVNIVRTQTLGEHSQDIDDMGLFTAEGARITVRQTTLGAHRCIVGLAGDLRGDSSSIDVDTRYLGQDDQQLDFNYILRHHGRETKCNLQANGVLAGRSEKTLRGTIDLIRGCKGSEGSERETVLLIDENVRNKTVPVILCNEDDVAGNHGATIGHIRDEQRFYLASRGLSQEAAERLFAAAVVEQAALEAPNPQTRTAVVRLGERLSPGFAELFEEEA